MHARNAVKGDDKYAIRPQLQMCWHPGDLVGRYNMEFRLNAIQNHAAQSQFLYSWGSCELV